MNLKYTFEQQTQNISLPNTFKIIIFTESVVLNMIKTIFFEIY
jgi:hypothetical protein